MGIGMSQSSINKCLTIIDKEINLLQNKKELTLPESNKLVDYLKVLLVYEKQNKPEENRNIFDSEEDYQKALLEEAITTLTDRGYSVTSPK